MKKNLFLIISLFLIVQNSWATPAYPKPIQVIQPDGSVLTIKINGDEHFHYTTSEDGLLIKQSADGYYRFALMNEYGDVNETDFVCRPMHSRMPEERAFVEDVLRYHNFSQTVAKVWTSRFQKNLSRYANAQGEMQRVGGYVGGTKYLVLLVGYSDLPFTSTKERFNDLLNKKGYSQNNAVGSVRDYFEFASNGAFSPKFDVVGPLKVSQTMKYYGEDDRYGQDSRVDELIVEACSLAVAQGLNLRDYDTNGDGYVDNVCVFYAGYGTAEGGSDDAIWPHCFEVYPVKQVGGVRVKDYVVMPEFRGRSGKQVSGIGAFCHEFSHFLGLMDFYKTDGSSGSTLYDWDLMDGGCYNGPTSGDVPAGYSAYERFYMGWIKPEILKQGGSYSLLPLGSESGNTFLIAEKDVHNLNGENPDPKHFYLLENRQPISFDKYLPASGMLIWRILFNQTKWDNNGPNNSKPYGADIIEADGKESQSSLSKDTYPQTNNTSYSFTSSSGSEWGKEIQSIAKNGQNINFVYKVSGQTEGETSVSEASGFKISTMENRDWKIEAVVAGGNYSYRLYSVAGELISAGEFDSTATVSSQKLSVGSYIIFIENRALESKNKDKYQTFPVLKF